MSAASSLSPQAAELAAAEADLTAAQYDLAWELTKAAADTAGIVDPTPISDSISGAMSLAEGDLVGAGLSLVSLVPYLGDALAKTAKGSRAAKRLAELKKRVGALSAKVEKLRNSVRPSIKAISDSADDLSRKAAKQDCPLCDPPLADARAPAPEKPQRRKLNAAGKARKRLAMKFFKRELGISSREAKQLLRGIDLSKPIRTYDIPPPEKIYQWVRTDGKVGNYFVLDETVSPTSIGIRPDGRELREFDVPKGKKFTVMESTAKPGMIDDFSDHEKADFVTDGGGIQLTAQKSLSEFLNLNTGK